MKHEANELAPTAAAATPAANSIVQPDAPPMRKKRAPPAPLAKTAEVPVAKPARRTQAQRTEEVDVSAWALRQRVRPNALNVEPNEHGGCIEPNQSRRRHISQHSEHTGHR
jgi:hypothetical protein